MKPVNVAIAAFGLVSYAVFVACALLLHAFLITDAAPADAGTLRAYLDNMLLVLLFAVPHSVLARPAVKKVMAPILPARAERAFYVLVSSLTLIVLMQAWAPIGPQVWRLEAGPLRFVAFAVNALGWLVLVLATFQLDHWRLFGLRQALGLDGSGGSGLRTPWMYRRVRHPIMSGILLMIWATPYMGMDRLLLAVGFTAYILAGIRLEERDLRRELGTAYDEYARQVPALLPIRSRPGARTGGGARRDAGADPARDGQAGPPHHP